LSRRQYPVVQLSIDYTKTALIHFELAQKLNVLRYKGILIIGSGNIIHNLGLVDFKNFDKDNYGFDWPLKPGKSSLIICWKELSVIN